MSHLGRNMDSFEEGTAVSESDHISISWMGDAYEPRVLLHFDIRASSESIRRRVDRFLYGCRETRHVHGVKRVYRYPGLLERTAGRHFGQSVVISVRRRS